MTCDSCSYRRDDFSLSFKITLLGIAIAAFLWWIKCIGENKSNGHAGEKEKEGKLKKCDALLLGDRMEREGRSLKLQCYPNWAVTQEVNDRMTVFESR
jgi:hypothetical protein